MTLVAVKFVVRCSGSVVRCSKDCGEVWEDCSEKIVLEVSKHRTL